MDQYSDRGVLKYEKLLDIYIIPDIITSDEDVRSLTAHQRNCYLENERKLKYFKIYTQRNCQIECLSQELLNTCACVPFDIIRGRDTRVCEYSDDECAEKIRREFTLEGSSCSCLQPCDTFIYSYQFVQSDHKGFIPAEERFARSDEFKFYTKYNIGQLTVQFKEKEFPTRQRVRTFTTVDFLSQIGGLLGLFAGISVLSLFEVFYFLTLRLLCEIFRYLTSKNDIKLDNILIVAPANGSA